VKLIDLIKNKQVHFIHFRDDEFIYKTDDGFEFPIPMSDLKNQKLTLLATDKAIYFMRWIRKQLELVTAIKIVEAKIENEKLKG